MATYTGTSIVDYLKSIGEDPSYAARAKRAADMGIQGYKGTAEQNTYMLNALRDSAAKANTAPKSPVTPVSPDITGLTGLRDYGTGKGLDIGWSRETGPTVGGTPISTEGLVMKDDKWYGDLNQLNSLFAPFEKQTQLSGTTYTGVTGTGSTTGATDTGTGEQKQEEYKSLYDEKILGMLDKYLNPEPYQNPHEEQTAAFMDKYLNEAPYQGQFDEQTMAALNKYLNPESFKFNVEESPSFQSYKNMYEREGERAFQDVIGQLSTLTGGRPNTWATSAAAQAQNAYNEKLMDIVPQLEQQAYGRYQDEYANLANQLNMLQNLDATSYGRYRDEVADTANKLNMLQNLDTTQYSRHKDEVADTANKLNMLQNLEAAQYGKYADERNFGITEAGLTGTYKGQPTRAAMESDRNYDISKANITGQYQGQPTYQATRDQLLDERYMKELDYTQQQDAINNAFQNRQISIQEKNYLLNKAESDYSKEQEEKTNKPLTELYTPNQLNYYKNAFSYLTERDPETAGNPQAALNKAMRPSEKLAYEKSMGKELYQQLIQDLQNNIKTMPQVPEEEPPYEENYSDLYTRFSSMDPKSALDELRGTVPITGAGQETENQKEANAARVKYYKSLLGTENYIKLLKEIEKKVAGEKEDPFR